MVSFCLIFNCETSQLVYCRHLSILNVIHQFQDASLTWWSLETTKQWKSWTTFQKLSLTPSRDTLLHLLHCVPTHITNHNHWLWVKITAWRTDVASFWCCGPTSPPETRCCTWWTSPGKPVASMLARDEVLTPTLQIATREPGAWRSMHSAITTRTRINGYIHPYHSISPQWVVCQWVDLFALLVCHILHCKWQQHLGWTLTGACTCSSGHWTWPLCQKWCSGRPEYIA